MKNSKKASLETVLKAVVSLGGQVADIKKDMATKNDLERVKEELLNKLVPVERAVDSDAVAIVQHGKRITRIEKHLALK